MEASSKLPPSLLETILADPELMQRAAASSSISLTVTLEIDPSGNRRIDHPQWRGGLGSVYRAVADPASTLEVSTLEAMDLTHNHGSADQQSCIDEGFVPSRSIVTPGNRPSADTDYRLVGKLGSGGTGIVYQAHQRSIVKWRSRCCATNWLVTRSQGSVFWSKHERSAASIIQTLSRCMNWRPDHRENYFIR